MIIATISFQHVYYALAVSSSIHTKLIIYRTLLSGIQNARSEFDAKYTVTSNFQNTNVPVTITGIGFFDFLHEQTGVAPNAIELHPVLDIQFGANGTATPSPTDTPVSMPTDTPIPTPAS